MFRHKEREKVHPAENEVKSPPVENSSEIKDTSKPTDVTAPVISSATKKIKDFSLSEVGDLLEKNLKWSQIIYEQNRRLNSKFFWMAFAGWLRIIFIAVVLLAGLWFLPPLLGNVIGQYQAVLGDISNTNDAKSGNPADSTQKLLQMLPLNSAQQEQLKALLK